MRDDQDRAALGSKAGREAVRESPALPVEASARLVEHVHGGLERQDRGERYPARLTAGQLERRGGGKVGVESHELEGG